MRLLIIWLTSFIWTGEIAAQKATDSAYFFENRVITLSPVVINNKLNIAAFIQHIKNDTSFYKSFRNLHILNFSAINDIRMNNGNGTPRATLFSKTRQARKDGCRTMRILEEKVTGDMYDNNQFNYYTAKMYASLFFTNGSVCGENNIVKGVGFSTDGKEGLEKHQEQLKMLFFNPGNKIKGIPFMSDKTALFDEHMLDKYDMSIDMDEYNKTSCYVFKQKVKPGFEGDVVVNEMTTWFDDSTFDVMARNYNLSYNAGVYDFKVFMEVQMTRVGKLVVPSLIRYTGNWKVIFKRRERGIFTATLFDFSMEK